MKVFFIEPPHKIWEFFRGHTPAPGMTYVATYVEKDFEVKYIDATSGLEHPWADLEKIIREEKPDVVGLTSVATCFCYDALNAAHLIKLIDPSITVISGGSMMSFTAEQNLRSGYIDFVIMGEGEITVMELLKAIEKSKNGEQVDYSSLKGIAYLPNGKVVYTEPRPFIEDLDSIPMPNYDLLPMDKFSLPVIGENAFVISTSRGCGGNCSFCSEAKFWKNQWRGNSAKYIVDHMELVSKKYGKTTLMFGDNDFLWDPQRNEEFCEELERRKLKDVHFWIQANPKNVVDNKKLLPWLKKLGLFQVMMGTESMNKEKLKHLRKAAGVQTQLEAMKSIKDSGVVLMTMMMWGDWNDDKSTLIDTWKFYNKYADTFPLTAMTPFPGTDYYKEVEKKGIIADKDFSNFTMVNVVMPTKHLGYEEAKKVYTRGLAKYFIHWRVLREALFSKNPFLRYQQRTYIKLAISNIVGNKWKQKNYMPFEDYMVTREA
jgi:anaerobic magnesium-protoporphyrin IX monomethyl ester cyclase